jgi:hypothetical protein
VRWRPRAAAAAAATQLPTMLTSMLLWLPYTASHPGHASPGPRRGPHACSLPGHTYARQACSCRTLLLLLLLSAPGWLAGWGEGCEAADPDCGCMTDTPTRPASHSSYPFCDTTKDLDDRVHDLVRRIKPEDKPNLLMARGGNQVKRPDGDKMQPLPYLGVPEYYWGTNCLHSVNNMVNDSGCISYGNCPASFPAGPGFAATFDRDIIRSMANTIGRELRSLYNARRAWGLDCWGPVVNLNRDP